MSLNYGFFRHGFRDEAGGPLVEAAILIPIVLIFLFGAIDFAFLFYQWNAAAKAVEVGARLAAVSDPVANGLNSISHNVLDPPSVNPGDTMPPFTITCNGGTGTCSCVGTPCGGTAITYNLTAMRAIVYGRAGLTSCGTPSSSYFAGMCNIFSRITPSNVQVVYNQTGMGFVDRPDGPQPTVTVSLLQTPDSAALKFRFFFISQSLLRLFVPGATFQDVINIPPFTTTMTGEALSSSAQPPP
jgi:hypothetical protein